MSPRKCEHCAGSGQRNYYGDPCRHCRGEGEVEERDEDRGSTCAEDCGYCGACS